MYQNFQLRSAEVVIFVISPSELTLSHKLISFCGTVQFRDICVQNLHWHKQVLLYTSYISV